MYTMNIGLNSNNTHHRRIILPLLCLSLFVTLAMAVDFVEAAFKNTSYYFSESFLFASFWWLFVPIFYGQFKMANQQGKSKNLLLVLVPVVLHLFTFAALVWVISALFYDHTFSYRQTFMYGLVSHLLTCCIAYSLPLTVFVFNRRSSKTSANATAGTQPINQQQPAAFVNSFMVNDGHKTISIATSDILSFEANPPYVNIQLKGKKYLLHQTLKAVLSKLDNAQFVRVHKSCIVNLAFVQGYHSRLNGDYDLLFKDGDSKRLSRNYAAEFKSKFKTYHQVNA